MPAQIQRWRRRIGVVAVVMAVALGACSTTPPPPLMSPIQFARYYGYADAPLGGDRYQVTYVGPNRRSLRSLSIRLQVGAEERTQVYDLALWRAAQIADASGFPGFRVSNVRSNTNTYSDDGYDPFYGPWYGPGFYPHRYPFGPYPGSLYWGPSPYAYQQADVTIDVQLLRSPGVGDYNAHDVIEQLRRTYPGAEGITLPSGPAVRGKAVPRKTAPEQPGPADKAPAT